MKHESKKHYRKLKRFVRKLGIMSAESNFDLIEDLMEAFEVGLYHGGTPDSIFVSPSTFISLSDMLKK